MSDQSKVIADGIASYGRQQRLILRTLKKRGSFTSAEFDQWFGWRGQRRRYRQRPLFVGGDDFILGGVAQTSWAWWLELIQCMMALGLVTCRETGGSFIYLLPAPPAR